MKYSIKVLALLICALLSSSIVCGEQSTNTIKIDLFKGSSSHWIAIAVQDGGVDTTGVQIRDAAQDAQWANMRHVDGWNYWITESSAEFVLPLSFRLISSEEQELVVENIITALGEDVSVDTGVQYEEPRSAAAARGHGHQRPTTAAPTRKPKAAATKAPSSAPAKASSSPSNKAPSTPVTTAPSTSTTSSGMGLLVPLYTYPTDANSGWSTVAANGKVVKTVAIINPDSGPGKSGPDSAFKTGMQTLQSGGVEMIGYVSTVYGTRAIADVKADIAAYASEYPEVVGIFLDECSDSASEVSFYSTLHTYIMSFPGYKYNVINPGAVPDQGYYAICTQMVSYEDTASKFAASANPSWANTANKDHFSVIAYGATASAYKTYIDAAKSKGYYGWVYFTDNTSAATYNTLPSYYAAMAAYTASKK